MNHPSYVTLRLGLKNLTSLLWIRTVKNAFQFKTVTRNGRQTIRIKAYTVAERFQ